MPVSPVTPRPGAGHRLAELIRLRTVSALHGEPEQPAVAADFEAFPELMARLYPLVHQRLDHEIVDSTGLLFRWRGARAADPLVLMAHWDVVPAPADQAQWTAVGWETDPFAGTEDHVSGEPVVRGRGALDDKGPLVALLEAVENLLAAGFTPDHDVWLVFGGDEEVGGRNAAAISDLLRERLREEQGQGAEPWLVLDEGGAVVPAPLSFVQGTCAMVGLAEKGQAQLRLTVSGAGGHASSPPSGTPIPRLARALRRLERRPFPARLNGTTSAMLGALTPLASGAAGRALPWALRSGTVAARALGAMGGEAAAMVRTTVAQTRLEAGTANNVLPSTASATLDCRIVPGETVAGVRDGIVHRIADPGVQVELLHGQDPSGESPADGNRFAALDAAVGTSWPDATTVPYLLMAATDSRHFHAWCRHVYRFAPLWMDDAQRASIHGENEWVSVASLERGERFHRKLITGRGGRFPDSAVTAPGAMTAPGGQG
ncbi:M20/M25/M40 family metallo-hydrolase [Citricoccus parietis]|uniref:M20/M25/M40 family metallo-hydrolase n=2 Tax=Citricoccus parietis TaxID=592307 RepID=A0ABV6F367_9MICC